LTPDSIQQKYAQTVASTWITPSCLQFLGEKKRFHTAWTQTGHRSRAGCGRISQIARARPLQLKRQDLSGEQPQQRASISVWPIYFCV
jgi:hypothetical protein